MTRKVIKEFTYYALIKDAIRASPGERATTFEIFTYVRSRHPTIFKNSNSMTWKGNIRQLLSKHPEFKKLDKQSGSKLHYWVHRPMEEVEEEENRLNNCLKDSYRPMKKKDEYSNYDQYGYYWIDYWSGSKVPGSDPIKNSYENKDKDKKY